MEDAVLECGGECIGMMGWTGGRSSLEPTTPIKNELCTTQLNTLRPDYLLDDPYGFGDRFTTMTRRHTDTSRNT